ncbi:MAG: hypothetical protein HC802_01315 [Caldilineaceae bacterium]|nr:hypothetical protein [Caldilineaceae bacterium]
MHKIGMYPLADKVGPISVADGVANVSVDGQELHIVDVTQPQLPRLIQTLQLPGPITDLEAVGQRLYVASGKAGLFVLDTTNPRRPLAVGRFDTPDFAAALAITSESLFVADRLGGLWAITLPD